MKPETQLEDARDLAVRLVTEPNLIQRDKEYLVGFLERLILDQREQARREGELKGAADMRERIDRILDRRAKSSHQAWLAGSENGAVVAHNLKQAAEEISKIPLVTNDR